jgi:hypothetical protein
LHSFDRVIFKGHLSLAAPSQLENYVDLDQKVRRGAFMKITVPWYGVRVEFLSRVL